MDVGLLRGTAVRHHKDMSHGGGVNRPAQSHSVQLFAAPHSALLLITADQLLKVVIIRGCERLKYGGVFSPMVSSRIIYFITMA